MFSKNNFSVTRISLAIHLFFNLFIRPLSYLCKASQRSKWMPEIKAPGFMLLIKLVPYAWLMALLLSISPTSFASTINMTSPLNGASYGATGTTANVPLAINLIGAPGQKFDVSIDGVTTHYPYQTNINTTVTLAVGTHTISVSVLDTSYNSTSLGPWNFSVVAGGQTISFPVIPTHILGNPSSFALSATSTSSSSLAAWLS